MPTNHRLRYSNLKRLGGKHMEPQRVKRVREVFDHASELSEPDRSSYLDRACENDSEFRRRVEDLLARKSEGRGLLGGSEESEWALARPKAEPLFQAGDVLAGRFHIRDFLGRGGMGEVYKAEDSLGDVFALKAPLPQLVWDREYISRFINEIQLARKVTHPNVCRIFEFDWHRREGTDDVPFFTMDLLEGETLSSRLKRGGRFSCEDALPIAKQIAEGVKALHARDIFHRDLKPGNVMLTRDETGESCPVLMDFGLARGLSGAGPGSDTVTSRVMGTLDYMAPEQRAGGRIGKYSDVYSFGLILQNVVGFGSRLSPAEQKLKDLIRACTAHDPQDRPKDGKPLCELLGPIDYQPAAGGPTESATEDDSSAGQKAPLESFSEMDTATRSVAGFQTWIGAAVAVLVLSVPILWQVPAVNKPVADRLCAMFPGSSISCLLPEDKDLAILPIEVIADTPENQLIGDGYVRYLSDNLYRLYPNRRDHCVHFWETEKSVYSEKLILDGTMHVGDGRIGFEGKLRRVSDGLTVRTLGRQVRFDELPLLRETVLTDIVSMTGQSVAEPVLARWRSLGASDSESFLAYLKGLAHLDKAKKADQENHWLPATAEFDRALGAGLGFALAAVGLGDAYCEGFRITGEEPLATKAEQYYRQTHSADILAALHSGRGQLDVLRGDRLAGIGRLEEALRLGPFNFSTRERLAATFKAMNRLSDAMQVMEDGMLEQPECWRLNNALARFYLDSGDYMGTEQNLLRSIQISTNNAAAYGNLARVYFITGRYQEAVEMGTHALQLDEGPQKHSTVGQAYVFGGCSEQGVAHLRRSVASPAPDRYIYWLNMAETLRFVPGHEDEVESATRNSVREARDRMAENPNDETVLRFLARGLAWLGERRAALETLDLLEKVDPDSIVRYKSVAAVHELLGDRGAAMEALEEVIQLGVTPSDVRHNPAFRDLVGTRELSRLLRQYNLDPLAASREPFTYPCFAP